MFILPFLCNFKAVSDVGYYNRLSAQERVLVLARSCRQKKIRMEVITRPGALLARPIRRTDDLSSFEICHRSRIIHLIKNIVKSILTSVD